MSTPLWWSHGTLRGSPLDQVCVRCPPLAATWGQGEPFRSTFGESIAPMTSCPMLCEPDSQARNKPFRGGKGMGAASSELAGSQSSSGGSGPDEEAIMKCPDPSDATSLNSDRFHPPVRRAVPVVTADGVHHSDSAELAAGVTCPDSFRTRTRCPLPMTDPKGELPPSFPSSVADATLFLELLREKRRLREVELEILREKRLAEERATKDNTLPIHLGSTRSYWCILDHVRQRVQEDPSKSLKHVGLWTRKLGEGGTMEQLGSQVALRRLGLCSIDEYVVDHPDLEEGMFGIPVVIGKKDVYAG
ncbi:hypothetical protein BDK51DRAFT_40467 [Blyttiomyces helicus]|uniref:Uncharacterized protein n=1 Tax=Blyttiomyces helicus TaxID=388810 RepID=A0A4P9W142_9FUNG|nr:hypothetical protein BDK51DRAFT_40467 [Blyttiomyces helicus]|eukprot:RKO85824.1 hypothetical protein BDK51DRAFT_40467 [Blyttiomyces helicus]